MVGNAVPPRLAWYLAIQMKKAFADQMMHPDWFGKEKVPTFKGENISDYSDYLGQTDFTLWNLKSFQDYRALHNKPEKKWSDTLFKTFHHLCYEMDEIYKNETC